MVDLLPGGQFSARLQEWLAGENLKPRFMAHLPTFAGLAKVVQAGQAAAILPEMAAVDFDAKRFKHGKIDILKPRTLVLIGNARSLNRSGMPEESAQRLRDLLQTS